MTKQNVETPDMEVMGEVAISKTETFLAENGKRVTMAIFAVIVIAVALFGYKALVVEPSEARAVEAIYSAQLLFEGNTPDYMKALEGDAVSAGFLEIIDNYGSTPTGNIANHYAGICYLKLGDLNNAKRYLKQYKVQKGIPAQIIMAQNLGLQGDIAVNESSYAEAVKLFSRAAEFSDNPLTTPLFLRKAAQAAQAAGDEAQAKALYESVAARYPNTNEARNAQKYLGTIK